MSALSRGLRLNNPGNVRKSVDKWQGLSETQGDPTFFTFKSPLWGIRAIARILITYQDEHNCFSIKDHISRWAPPSENPTSSYMLNVAGWANKDVDEVLNVHTYADCRALVTGIIRQENGYMPYSEAQIEEALKLAGVVKAVEPAGPLRAIATDPKVIATTIAGSAAAAQATVSSVSSIWDDLAQRIDPRFLIWACVAVVAVLGIAFVLDRLKARREGRT